MALFSRKRTVFSGGMCNVIGEDGRSIRNPDRDDLNKALKAVGHTVFDPQIDEISHGRSYNYEVDGPAEQDARAKADVLIYQVGDTTMAGVTMLEVLKDVTRGRKVVLWLSGEPDAKGRPVFRPAGFKPETIEDAATKAHVAQMVKQGSSMRANLLDFIKGADNLKVVKTADAVKAALRDFGIRV